MCRETIFRWIVSLVGLVSAAQGQETIDLADRWELFLDDYVIERLEGEIALRLHRPVAREVVLVHDAPWEGSTCGYHTVFQDEGICRMYYRGWGHGGPKNKQLHPAVVCYAESRDGITWRKPKLGLVEFDGSKVNNIILEGFGTHNFVPFKDTNPACPAEARYKAVAQGDGDGHSVLFAFQSSDGIHWQRLGDEPIITDGAFDSQNLVFWDSVRGQYRAYFRDFRDGVRDIKTATSDDFRHWTEGVWLDYGDAPKEHLYTNQIQPYYRSAHLFVGFPTRFIPDRGALTEGLFMSSRDGVHFHRWGEAIIRPGQNRDKWHNRSNYIWLGMIETASTLPGGAPELSIFSNEGYYEGPSVQTRRYTYRIDGFVSLGATYRGGQMITKPLTVKGDQLAINVSTSAAGSVNVEIQDAAGEPLDGYDLAACNEIYGDEIERVVTWSGNDLVDVPPGPIRLHFVLHDADVFAFGFRAKP